MGFANTLDPVSAGVPLAKEQSQVPEEIFANILDPVSAGVPLAKEQSQVPEDRSCAARTDDDETPSQRLERLLQASAAAEAVEKEKENKPRRVVPVLPWGIEDTMPEAEEDSFARFVTDEHLKMVS